MTSPKKSSGVVTSTSIIGSRMVGIGLPKAALTASEPAILNAISCESTSWYEPSTSVTLTSTIGIAGEDAALERLADARVDRRDVLARDRAADDLVDELVAGARLARLDLDLDVAVLAVAARLAHEAAVAVGRLADRLAVGHLRPADVGLDPELAHHAVDQHVEVQLAHAGDDRLAGLRVGLDAEGRVFLGQALQGDGHLVLVGLRLGLDLDLDDRLGEGDRLEDHRVVGLGTACRR